MKKVLVPLATYKFGENECFMHAARETYISKLLKYDKMPIFISCKFPLEEVRVIYDKCDSVMFMGGGDFDPACYDETCEEKTLINNPLEDEFELEILSWVLEDQKRFLGICRGCQALAIASGGKLFQHIPESFPSENHGFSEGGITYAELYMQGGHIVNLDEDSRIAKLTGKAQVSTNTAHHQSVKDVGAGFQISGRSEAGVAEIIEAIDPAHFCYGVQSHLENFREDDLEILFEKL